MNDKTFRRAILGAVLLFGLIVVHDIWAKRAYERGIENSVRITHGMRVNRWMHDGKDSPQPTKAEIEIEYRATNKPSTWLF